MPFITKLDYSDNRQIKQHIETLTVLSGATSFGVTFNELPTGPNLLTSGITESFVSVGSTFSGNSGTTIYTWYDSRMELGASTLSALTPSNSGITQNTGQVYTANTTTVIDGNMVTLTYSGVSFDVTVTGMTDLGGGNYSGDVSTFILDILSASTLDFTGRTIWVDVSGITRTEDLIITNGAVPGYVWSCADSEGRGYWESVSAATSTLTDLIVTGGTYNNPTGTATFSNITGGTFDVSGFFTGTTDANTFVTGGTYSNPTGTATYTNNSGGTFDVVGFKTGDTYWVSGSSGTNSIKANNGSALISNGDYSVAEGFNTIATGNTSHAEGSGTTAGGDYSHAEGLTTKAIGESSHAEGSNTIASGQSSHAEGSITKAIGDASHAEGSDTTASGQFSHTEGNLTQALGFNSHAEGDSSIASGTTSHAEGISTTASGNISHAEGNTTIALGTNSHAEGDTTIAIGIDSHAEGISTTAQGDYSHAEGQGTTATTLSHSEGFNTKAIGYNSHAEGDTTTASGEVTHAEGSNTTASGSYSHAEGLSTIASGNTSHAEGQGTTAGGTYSHAGGVSSSAIGIASFVHGSGSTATGDNTIVFGNAISGTAADTTYVADLIIDGLVSTDPIATDANGKIVAGASDIRLKKNINEINLALNKIKNLRGVSYEWTKESNMGEGVKYGFIAQEVEKIIPEIVKPRAKGDGMLTLNYVEIIPWLVEAVKEMSSGITTSGNIYLETQTILAEDNDIELNYSGTTESAINGGIRVLHAMGENKSAEMITDEDGNWITNNDFKPRAITIPFYTPNSSDDENGEDGNMTRDNNYLYIRTNNGWRRSNLDRF